MEENNGFPLKTKQQGHLGGSDGSVSASGSGQDLRVLGSSPESGFLLSGEPASASASPLLPTMLSLALSQINKLLKQRVLFLLSQR